MVEQRSVEQTHEVTALLHAWRAGDTQAGEALLARVYAELRRMARGQLRREHLSTLEPTALVHEAFLRLVDQKRAEFHDRSHFFAIAATVMRRVLVDQARARLADKRHHLAVPLAVATDLAGSLDRDPELLDLDRALERLAVEHARAARVVEMRFFAGLGEREIGEALGVGERTVKRDWAFARAWLLADLARGER